MNVLTRPANEVGSRAAHATRRVGAWFKKWELALQVRRERRALSRLDDRMLKDIGLSRADASREAGRAFHDVGPRSEINPGEIAGYHMIRFR
ncbi:MAG: DUF1127 domain-containing protein [Pseudomonadota bacterium]